MVGLKFVLTKYKSIDEWNWILKKKTNKIILYIYVILNKLLVFPKQSTVIIILVSDSSDEIIDFGCVCVLTSLPYGTCSINILLWE